MNESLKTETPVIEVEQVGKKVSDAGGPIEILRDVNWVLNAGQTAAIVGASGSGKSSLLAIMAGLDVPSAGTVRLLGQDLFAVNEDERAALRARYSGFVFQNFQLVDHFTALENVMLPLELAGRPRARQEAAAMLQRVGLGERLAHLPRLLSGGEQQRVALARAFVVQPRLLFADEPTGSLDVATGERVMNLMFELNREHGTALALVTHDLGLARRCQQVWQLENGCLSL